MELTYIGTDAHQWEGGGLMHTVAHAHGVNKKKEHVKLQLVRGYVSDQ